MAIPESLGHAAAENEGPPPHPGGDGPQARCHHAPHVDGRIKIPMGPGDHRRITSNTTDTLDLNGIVRRVDDGLDKAEIVSGASCKARPKAWLSIPRRPMFAAPHLRRTTA